MNSKQIIALIILVPIAIILIAFIVANRQMVTLNLDPFTGSTTLSFTAPFFIWLFIMLGIGIIIGGITTWITQSRHRKAARQAQSRIEEMRAANLLPPETNHYN